MAAASTTAVQFDHARYRRVIRYFAGVFVQLIFWEIVLRGLLGREFVGRSAERRWQQAARGYRIMAVELGGLLIKLGQFLSIRVDFLPRVVTAELAGLQDKVPPERSEDIRAVIETEYNQPIDRIFGSFASQPQAAASLAQVHRARLLTGDEVMVKVQRPRIEQAVETDLRAIRTTIQWLKRYRPVRRRVDLDQLYEEFSRTTRNELDFIAEGHNAERFAEIFQADSGVRIPRVYAATSTRRVLIMENVTSLKIDDFEAIDAVGIDRKLVARQLFETYLRQIFVHNFVHADPHPGNLFVQPLPPLLGQPRPFRLVFVDFGMVAVVPERVRQHIRDFLLGFATRDAGRIVRAYRGAGVLLPSADLVRLEQMEADMLERYSGLTMRQAQQVAMSEWQGIAREYRDILYEMPFQFPTDLLFIGRAMAILFGMATSLDPDFDAWQVAKPFAEKLAADEAKRDWRGLLEELEKTVRLIVSLPGQADRFFSQASRGELTMRTSWTPEAMRSLHAVRTAVNRLAGAVVFAALLLAAVAVYLSPRGGVAGYVLFAAAGIALLITLLRR